MNEPITQFDPPAVPLPNLDQWTAQLTRVAEQPLEFSPQFPAIAQRHERWWLRQPTDRPLFLGAVNSDPGRPINRRLGYLDDSDAWFQQKLTDVTQLRRIGDTLPSIRADIGPAALGALLGAPTTPSDSEDTAWTHPFIDDDWSNARQWHLDDDNPWWRLLNELLDRVTADAVGRYLVSLPDFGGASDALMNMRGAEQLCMDIIEQPDRIREAMGAIYPIWRQIIDHVFAKAIDRGAGLVHWLGIWSNQPYILPTCDLNYMLSPDDFNAVCLPDIDRLAQTACRTLFHLDGPPATAHIDALLSVPAIDAIQFTPGAATPSALPWIDMFANIQQHNRALLVMCPVAEVGELCRALAPEGLAVMVEDDPDRFDETFATLCEISGADAV